MSDASQLLETSAGDMTSDERLRASCIQACLECARTCTECADRCLSEQLVGHLVTCIAANINCADVCATTGRVLIRQTAFEPDVARTLLDACAQACKTCGDECARHAEMHRHCEIAAAACRACEHACRELRRAIGS